MILNIYSGRRNPEWQLDEVEAVELLRRLHLDDARSAVTPSRLGFRGFTVIDERLPRSVEIVSGPLAEWLAERLPDSIEASIRDLVRRATRAI